MPFGTQPDRGLNRLDLRRIGLLVAGAMCVIPFLQPRHFPPIRSFYDEWLAFALGLGAAIFSALARRNALSRIPVLGVWLGAFALAVGVRTLVAPPAYFQSSVLWAIYALFAALMALLGHDLANHLGRDRVCGALASWLLAGSLANSIAGLLQVTGIPAEIDYLVAHLRGARAIGNVGQPNLYANYLALGAASLVYLYSRGRLTTIPVIACGLVLVAGAALAASRSYVVYTLAFALLAVLALRRRQDDMKFKRLATAALLLVSSALLAQWLIPVGMNALGFQIEAGYLRSGEPELRDESANLRLIAWNVALRLFAGAPLLGVGPGEFGGAAFALGLPEKLAGPEIWTTPHNLILQLLAETGLLGAILVCAGLGLWLLDSARSFLKVAQPADWWILACVSVELLHAMVEYPLWYAHFLAVTALIMGVGAGSVIQASRIATPWILWPALVAGCVLLATHLAAYLRFDLSSSVATGRSMATESQERLQLESLAELGNGLLAPRAELFLFLAFALHDEQLAEKLAVGERVLRVWPSREVVARQSIFLALSGREEEARALMAKGLQTFGNRTQSIAALVQAAPAKARDVLEPELRFHREKP
jgi:O-antigen ligase